MTNCKGSCYSYFPARSPILQLTKYAFAHLVLLNCKQIVTFDILKRFFLTTKIVTKKLPESPGNGISETLNLKISSAFGCRSYPPNQKELPTALHAYVICLSVNIRIFVCKLRLHFPDSKHLRGFVFLEIFGNFFCHSENFGLHTPPLPPHTPPPPTIHASYGPDQN